MNRLERAGILRTETVGRTRLVHGNQGSPLYRPLAELVLKSFGPLQIVAEEFDQILKIDEIYVFGSWAARYLGEQGRNPGDVDVLVIGSPDRDAVYEAALRAERRLGVDVNPTIRSSDAWRGSRDGFIRQVKSSPLVRVDRDQ
ncbi:MAG TPA: nucleotidyltransferase domain-containing protein [Actinomycetota bacterium]